MTPKGEMMTLTLKTQWIARLKLRAESGKLRAEGGKLRAEGDKLRADSGKLRAEGNKLSAEGNKLWAEGNNLWAEGNKLWAEAILSAFGNITIEWKWRDGVLGCHLGNGEVYLGDIEVTE